MTLRTEHRVAGPMVGRSRTTLVGRLVALCVVTTTLVGCSSTGGDDRSDPAASGPRAPATTLQAPGTAVGWRSPADVVAVDRLGFAWSVERRGDRLRLTAWASDGTPGRSIDVDAGRGERLSGLAVQPLGDGIALGRRICQDTGCDRSRMAIERFHRLSAGAQQVGRRWSSTIQRSDAAIGAAGRTSKRAAFVGDGLVAVVDEGGKVTEVETGDQADAWDPCLSRLGLLAIRYVPAAGGDPTDAAAVPTPDAEQHRLSLLVHGPTGWESVEGSDLTHDGAPPEYARCTANGIEQGDVGSLATRLWDGSGAWRHVAVASPPLGAQGGSPFDGLVTVRDGKVERLDTVGGSVLDSITIPADLVERTLATGLDGNQYPDLGNLTMSAGRDPVVVACRVSDSTGGTKANPVFYRCDRFV